MAAEVRACSAFRHSSSGMPPRPQPEPTELCAKSSINRIRLLETPLSMNDRRQLRYSFSHHAEENPCSLISGPERYISTAMCAVLASSVHAHLNFWCGGRFQVNTITSRPKSWWSVRAKLITHSR